MLSLVFSLADNFALAKGICSRQLADTDLNITEEDIVAVQASLDALAAEKVAVDDLSPENLQGLDQKPEVVGLHPIAALDTYEKWLKMSKTRPDLVVAAAIKIIDAVNNKEVDATEGVALLAVHLDVLVEVMPNGNDYAYVLDTLPVLFKNHLKGGEYAKGVAALLRARSKKLAQYKQDLLSRVENVLLTVGFERQYYKTLGDTAPTEAVQWNNLRTELMDQVADRGDRLRDLTRYLEAKSFSIQFSAYIRMLRERHDITPLLKLLAADPLDGTNTVSPFIQNTIFSIARVPKPDDVLPRDFPIVLALKNINRAFKAKLEFDKTFLESEVISIFETSFSDSALQRHASVSFFEGMGREFHGLMHLAFTWEKILIQQLEGGGGAKIPEATLLEDASDVPEFIFRFTYQHTESSQLRAFLAKLERLRNS